MNSLLKSHNPSTTVLLIPFIQLMCNWWNIIFYLLILMLCSAIIYYSYSRLCFIHYFIPILWWMIIWQIFKEYTISIIIFFWFKAYHYQSFDIKIVLWNIVMFTYKLRIHYNYECAWHIIKFSELLWCWNLNLWGITIYCYRNISFL